MSHTNKWKFSKLCACHVLLKILQVSSQIRWILCKCKELQIKDQWGLKLNLCFMVEQFQILLLLWPQTGSFWTICTACRGHRNRTSVPVCYIPQASPAGSKPSLETEKLLLKRLPHFTEGNCFLKLIDRKTWARIPPAAHPNWRDMDGFMD